MHAVLVRLLQDVVQAESLLERGQAAGLAEVNEQLVVAAHGEPRQGRSRRARAGACGTVRGAGRADAACPIAPRLLDRFQLAVANARRHGLRLALLFLDLDDFKRINDTLRPRIRRPRAAPRRRTHGAVVRGVDTVSRHGGDEFLILLTELSEPGDARALAEQAGRGGRRAVELDGRIDRASTASVGIAIYPDDGEDADTLIAACRRGHVRGQAQRGRRHCVPRGGVGRRARVRALSRPPPRPAPRERAPRRANPAQAGGSARGQREAGAGRALGAGAAGGCRAGAAAADGVPGSGGGRAAQSRWHPSASRPRCWAAPARANRCCRGSRAFSSNSWRDMSRAGRQAGRRLGRTPSGIAPEPPPGRHGKGHRRGRCGPPTDDGRTRAMVRVDRPPGALGVQGDAGRLEQIVGNLLDNASRHTHEGGRIRLAAVATDDTLTLTVSDDGIGITPQMLPHRLRARSCRTSTRSASRQRPGHRARGGARTGPCARRRASSRTARAPVAAAGSW